MSDDFSPSKHDSLTYSYKDYMQISIKNLGLMIVDKALSESQQVNEKKYFAIIPYPDFQLTSLTYFHLLKSKNMDKIHPCALSVLVKEGKRGFLYDHNQRIKQAMLSHMEKLEHEILTIGYHSSHIEPLFYQFLKEIKRIEEIPTAPITAQRKMKILFIGLDNSGKTSFLLTVDKKFSKLIGLKPTRGASITSIETLGATILLWDLGGQESLREKYLLKSQIYLYEADLIFYFIDLRDRYRFEESFDFLQNINIKLSDFAQKTPQVFIFSKGDPDVIDKDDVQKNVTLIKKRLIEITNNPDLEFYITSIFSVFSVLRAFSAGLSKLSPNRELINYNLEQFSEQYDIKLSMFLSTDGLVLADYYSSKAYPLFVSTQYNSFDEGEGNEDLRNLFQITAPQFTFLYKIFSKFKKLQEEEAVFKIANSAIILKKLTITDFEIFILFLVDDEIKKEVINQHLGVFIDRTKDLFLRYIS